ncbi:hypothetical protein QU487_06290 [Crenobacter sp. SG2305]|uniref:hypothetical protein n=1 Tax=Crenobacter oryzisoli TaxID=3056844 RepID=UPI0025AB588B|nr:hypothetical protein [Crenobacter sp. SG2305]MDN0082361.1 hypothetical protein [Crenobacter sp. SG2305]
MLLMTHDPAVQASLIGAIGTVAAALIAAVIAAGVSWQISNRRRLIEKLNMALDDIAFLLYVEKELCGNGDSPHRLKLETREKARAAGLSFSGKLTPGRVRHMRLPY